MLGRPCVADINRGRKPHHGVVAEEMEGSIDGEGVEVIAGQISQGWFTRMGTAKQVILLKF